MSGPTAGRRRRTDGSGVKPRCPWPWFCGRLTDDRLCGQLVEAHEPVRTACGEGDARPRGLLEQSQGLRRAIAADIKMHVEGCSLP